MKKTVSTLVLLILVISFSFATTTFSFSGNCTVVGADIKKTDYSVGSNGIVIKTNEDTALAESNSISVKAGSNSLVGILDNGEVITVYLIYGEASIVNENAAHVKLYTPVTLIETDAPGEIYLTSKENEEKVLNLTGSNLKAYDALRAKYVTVPELSEHDYFLDSTYLQNGEVEKKVATPVTPVFIDASIVLSLPDMPSFSEVDASLDAPETPLFTESSSGNN